LRSRIWDHKASSSMLAIFPTQDLLSIYDEIHKEREESEQIHSPGNP
jgi:hypothetical protein